MRYGVTLKGIYEPAEWIELVQWIEDLGFDNLWITDSSLHAGDCYVCDAGARADLVDHRRHGGHEPAHPPSGDHGERLRSLCQLAPGRVACGIGVGDRPLFELGLPMARIGEMRDTIDVVRRLARRDHRGRGRIVALRRRAPSARRCRSLRSTFRQASPRRWS